MDIFLAALPAVEDEQLILTRMRFFLGELPRENGGAFGDAFNLLVAACERIPTPAKELVLHYQRGGSALRCYSVCQLFQRVPQAWSSELLSQYLDDKRSVDGYSRNDQPIRVCDEAAETLSRIRRDLAFDTAGSYAELDRRIEDLKQKLKEDQHEKVK